MRMRTSEIKDEDKEDAEEERERQIDVVFAASCGSVLVGNTAQVNEVNSNDQTSFQQRSSA